MGLSSGGHPWEESLCKPLTWWPSHHRYSWLVKIILCTVIYLMISTIYSTVPWGEWDSEFDIQNVDKLPYLIIDPFSNKKVISCHVIDCIHNIGCRLLCISNNTNYCYLKINDRSLAEHFLSWDHWNDSHCQQNSNNHLWRTTFLYYRLKAIKS